MSLGPRTQNEITTAITKIPGILKWLGQLDEKVKNLNLTTTSINKNNDLAIAIADLTTTFDKKNTEVLSSMAKFASMEQVEQLIKLIEKQEIKLTKQQKNFETEMKKTISNLEKKIIDLSKQNVNNSRSTRNTKENIESENKGE